VNALNKKLESSRRDPYADLGGIWNRCLAGDRAKSGFSGVAPGKASPHETIRAVMVAVSALGARLKKAA